MSAKSMIRVTGKPTLGRGDLTLTVKFALGSLKLIETPFGVIFDLENAHISGEPGTPGFPMQVLRVALPPFSDVATFEVAIAKRANVTKKPVFVAPIQEPRPGGPARRGDKETIKPSLHAAPRPAETDTSNYVRMPRAVTLPQLEKYQRVLAAPAPPVRIASIEHRGAATVLTLEVNPVSQNKNGIVELATEIRISLSYESTTTPKTGGPFIGSRDFRQARTKVEAKRFADILRGDVVNPDWIGDISDHIPKFYAQYDYLVITDNQGWDPVAIAPAGPVGDLVTSFRRLVDWKRRRGLRARVVTIADIVAGTHGDFKTGARDLQEVLRNFIKWAYSHWDISWVLLGGDISIVPVRIVASGCRGQIGVDTVDPPNDNASYWTGTYLRMHVVNPGEWWPGDWPLILVNPASGTQIPYDAAGTSTAANPGWYYVTDNTYATRTAGPTQFVRVNGPAALLNATLQWLYRWNRIPTDLYYSSVVGANYNVSGLHDWDLIDNELYGQHTDGADMDGVSYAADIGVGRAPVQSVAEAEAFVNKVIAYEQFRRPDGTSLDPNWPRRLVMVSSNWGGRIGIWSTATNPPGDNQYHHGGADPYSLIKLKDIFSDLKWHLFAVVTETDIRTLPYDPDSASSGRGWYFAISDANLNVSEFVVTFFGMVFRIPVPTQWVVVYGYADEVTPQYYVFDRAEADGSMADQETLRKQIDVDFPGIDVVRRLYEDEIDLPAADAASPPVSHLTENRLRDTLNLGQHFVSLSGHGSQGGCCALSNTLAQSATNGYHTFIAWADSCLTNDFQVDDSMSEDLLTNPNGGAVGYVGNTRFSWIGLGDDYQREFFSRLKTVRHLALLNDSRFNLANDWAYYKWIKFALNLLGDPEMSLWVGKPKAMKVAHPAKIYKTDQHVLVKVTTSSNVAIANAVVCLAMGDWVASATTDAGGQADLHINPPALGNMEVVATAQDYVPYFGTISVEEYVPCKTAILCKAGLGCKTAILCKASISCGPSILCGPQIVPCGGKIACSLAISCGAGIGTGCPAIDPIDWGDPIDIFKECGIRDIKELAAKQNTPRVKKVIAKLSPANRKALTLMLRRIGKG